MKIVESLAILRSYAYDDVEGACICLLCVQNSFRAVIESRTLTGYIGFTLTFIHTCMLTKQLLFSEICICHFHYTFDVSSLLILMLLLESLLNHSL